MKLNVKPQKNIHFDYDITVPIDKKNGICIANKPFFPKKEKFPFDPGKIQKNNLPSLIKAKK